MALVLLSVLWLIVHTEALAIRQTPEIELYKVVHPKKLHILHKRAVQNNWTETHGNEERYEPELQYQIILNGEVILSLQKTKHLLGPNYTETYYSLEGEEITTSPQNAVGSECILGLSRDPPFSYKIPESKDNLKDLKNLKATCLSIQRDKEHCYYKGHILNEKGSVASISTCNGLRGYFTHQNQRYMIKPLKSTDQEEHAVLTYNQEELDPANLTCGVKNVGRKHSIIRTTRSLNSPEREEFLRAAKHIDLFLVLDNAFYNMYQGNLTLMRSFLFEVMNLLNVIYNTIDVQVALVGMEIWSDGDKIKIEPNAGVTFTNFLNWHRSNLGKMKPHDHAQLLSGRAFAHKRAGVAAANSLCSPSSVAVIEANRKNNVALVAVMSHELGHALGMPDVPYTTRCPSGSCVMNEYLSSKFPKDFSVSSRSHFERYISSAKSKCLLQAPTAKDVPTVPVCGNQLLEAGEECDCGSSKECSQPCCEATDCKFKPSADCAQWTLNHTTK